MSFNDLMNNIFGAEWLGTLTQIASGIFMVFLTKIWSNAKNKLINSENVFANSLGSVLSKLAIQDTILTENKIETKESKEKIETLTNSVSSLANILSMAFLDSPAISSETKIAISNQLSNLQKSGMDLAPVQKVIDGVTKKAELGVEVVKEIKEEKKIIIEQTKKSAEEIDEKAKALLDSFKNVEETV